MQATLEPIYARFEHLAHYSRGAHETLTNTLLSNPLDTGSEFEFVQWDLNDFYSQREHSDIIRAVGSFFGGNKRIIVKHPLHFLLINQVFGSVLFPDWRFRLRRGLAMGLRFSTHAANLTFLHSVKLVLWGVNRGNMMRRGWGIRLYLRYIDNLLFIVHRSHKASLLQRLQNTILVYPGKLEASGRVVPFLDMERFIHQERVCTRAVHKPRTYISPSHQASIHAAWPRARIFRLRSLCSFKRDALKVCRLFERSLREAWDDDRISSLLLNLTDSRLIDPDLRLCHNHIDRHSQATHTFYLRHR